MRRTCVAIALLTLAFPAAAAARKNAWQLTALSGTYEYHATQPAPTTCSAGNAVLLKRDYAGTWHADSFGRGQYAAKYFPVFSGPQTNGAGQRAHLVHQGTLSETYRTFTEAADGSCTQQDQTCTKAVTFKGSRTAFMVTHARPGKPPLIRWDIDFAGSLPDCTPRGDSDLTGALVPMGSSTPALQPSTNGRFARKHPHFSLKGIGGITSSDGWTAQLTFSAKATLKKLVIPDGCADREPQRLFVCK